MENDKLREDGTGCCVRDDLNVCWQAHEEHCGSVFSTFHRGKVTFCVPETETLLQ